jgi:hypothetical protein
VCRPLGRVERLRRVVRFARLIDRRVRALGGPWVPAAYGGSQMPATSPLTVANAGHVRMLSRSTARHGLIDLLSVKLLMEAAAEL